MRKALVMFTGLSALSSWAQQRSAGTTLLVQVNPEQRLTPVKADFRLRVSADGSADLLSQTQLVTAWVRALPGQTIRVIANASALPGGAALRWAASAIRATGGAQNAACSSGAAVNSAPFDLTSNWTQSGVLTCAVTLQLTNPRDLPAGDYPVALTFTLRVE